MMARKRGAHFPAVALAAADVVLINVGFAAAWAMRYPFQLGRELAAADYLPLSDFRGIQGLLTMCPLVVYWLNGVYGRRRCLGLLDEVAGLTSGALVGSAIMIVAVFYVRPFSYSRLAFVYAAVIVVVLLALARIADRLWQSYLRRQRIGLRRVLVVGEGRLGRMNMQNFVAQPEHGYQIVGFVDEEPRQSLGRFPYLGPCADIAALVARHEIDEVIIALPSASHLKITEILIACARQKVRFRIVPDFYELSLNRVDVLEINGIPLIGLREPTLRGSDHLVKRTLDVALAATLLGLASPLMLAIALAIKLDTPGPIIHAQMRIGRSGKEFRFFKFRSMRHQADRELAKLLHQNGGRRPDLQDAQRPALDAGRALDSPLQPGRAAAIVQRAARQHESDRAASTLPPRSRPVSELAPAPPRGLPRDHRLVAGVGEERAAV